MLNADFDIPSKNDSNYKLRAVWPEKNRQMSIKVAQKWFH